MENNGNRNLSAFEQARQTRKTILCAALIKQIIKEDEGAVQACIAELQSNFGVSWNLVVALQFMSGKTAKQVIDDLPADERPDLLLVHFVAKTICGAEGLAKVEMPDGIDQAEFKAACLRLEHHPLRYLRT